MTSTAAFQALSQRVQSCSALAAGFCSSKDGVKGLSAALSLRRVGWLTRRALQHERC